MYSRSEALLAAEGSFEMASGRATRDVRYQLDKTPGWKDPPFLAPSLDIEEAGQDWLTFNHRVAGAQSMPTDMQSCGSVGVQLGQEGMAICNPGRTSKRRGMRVRSSS